jgi:hypothetical protein
MTENCSLLRLMRRCFAFARRATGRIISQRVEVTTPVKGLVVSGLLLASVAIAPRDALAACAYDSLQACIADCGSIQETGKQLWRQCTNMCNRTCKNLPGPAHFILNPNYFVLTVIYAPPGTNGGKSSSSVSYGSGSSTGTTTSSSNTFKASTQVSASVTGGVIGDATVGGSFQYSNSSGTNQSLDIKKSTSSTISDSGPASDGIDHDHDLIYLWLNPEIDLQMTSSSAIWNLINTGTADIQYLYVGWLKDPSKVPPGLMQRLQSHGVTALDFPTIMQRDPYANGSPPLDHTRYQSVNQTFPYEPPYSATDPVPTLAFNASYSTTSTSGSAATDDYKVSITAKGGVDFGVYKASFQLDDSWDWTNTTSQSSSTGSTESATVTVGGPAFGYAGPTDIAVYYDTVYKSFLFVPLQSGTLSLSGTLTNSNGTPVPRREVTVVANGTTYRTFTNAKGQYRFFGGISGPLVIHAGTVTAALPQVRPNVDLRLP